MWKTWTTNPPEGVQWFIASQAMSVSRLSIEIWVSRGSWTACGQPQSTCPSLRLATSSRVGLGSSITSLLAMTSSRDLMPPTLVARCSSETP